MVNMCAKFNRIIVKLKMKFVPQTLPETEMGSALSALAPPYITLLINSVIKQALWSGRVYIWRLNAYMFYCRYIQWRYAGNVCLVMKHFWTAICNATARSELDKIWNNQIRWELFLQQCIHKCTKASELNPFRMWVLEQLRC